MGALKSAAPPAKAAASTKARAHELNATQEAERLGRIAESLMKVAKSSKFPTGTEKVIQDVERAAREARVARSQGSLRGIVRNATAEVLALQARLASRMKELKADEKSDNVNYIKEASLNRLEAIAKSLRKVTAKHNLQGGDAILADVDKAVAAIKAEKDGAKVQETMDHAMAELHAFQESLEAQVAQATSASHTTGSKDKVQVLFDALYDIQDLPRKDQLAVVAKPEFKDLPEVKELLASQPADDEPLAISLGKILDAKAVKATMAPAAKKSSKQESIARIEHEILQHTNLTQDRAATLAPIVRELEGRLDRVEQKRQALEVAQKRAEESAAKILDAHGKGDDRVAKKANMVVKYLRKKTARQYKKKSASLDAESKALQDAIASIKAGKVDELQAAMKRLSAMKSKSQEFLH